MNILYNYKYLEEYINKDTNIDIYSIADTALSYLCINVSEDTDMNNVLYLKANDFLIPIGKCNYNMTNSNLLLLVNLLTIIPKVDKIVLEGSLVEKFKSYSFFKKVQNLVGKDKCEFKVVWKDKLVPFSYYKYKVIEQLFDNKNDFKDFDACKFFEAIVKEYYMKGASNERLF